MRLARPVFAGLAALACTVGFAAQPPGTELVTLDALQQQWIQGQIWCGVGDVVIHYQDITMHCDQVQVDQTTLMAHAEGDVIIDQGTTRMSCDRADFNLDKKTGTLYEVDAFFPPNYHFRGKELEKLDATHYRFHKGIFTSCDLDKGAPPWSIEIRDATVEMEGYGHFRDAALEVRGVPVFYTPRLVWPVKRDRAAGLLVPNIGYNSTHGAYLGNALFVPLSRSVDTTVFLDTWSKGWVGLADELRWAPAEAAKGRFLADTIYDKDTKRWEWKTEGKYDQLFAGGYSIHSELHQFSNFDFFQSFERTFDPNQARNLRSYFTLSRTFGPQVVNLQVDRLETFFGTTATPTTTTLIQERQPKLEYRLRSTRIGKSPFYFTLQGEADRLALNNPLAQRGKYSRFDLFPTVSMLAPGFTWLNVTPTLGARETYYSVRNTPTGTALEEKPLTRRYGTAGLSIVGPSISRIWSGKHAKFKHLFEPRIEYTFVSNPGKEFSILPPVTPIFDEKDIIQVTNSVKYTLANALFIKEGDQSSRELGRLEISQVYSLSNLINPSVSTPVAAFPPTAPSRRGALEVWLHASPTLGITLDSRSDFDAITHHLVATNLSGGLIDGTNVLNLVWSNSFDPTSGATLFSQTFVQAAWGPKSGHWRLESQVAYDLHQKKLGSEQFTLRWRGSCWTAYAQYIDNRVALYPARDYRIAIDLTGLGTFLDVRGSLNTATR